MISHNKTETGRRRRQAALRFLRFVALANSKLNVYSFAQYFFNNDIFLV